MLRSSGAAAHVCAEQFFEPSKSCFGRMNINRGELATMSGFRLFGSQFDPFKEKKSCTCKEN